MSSSVRDCSKVELLKERNSFQSFSFRTIVIRLKMAVPSTLNHSLAFSLVSKIEPSGLSLQVKLRYILSVAAIVRRLSKASMMPSRVKSLQ